MNLDMIHGKWKQMMVDVKIQWGKLTDDDMIQIDGNKDKLIGLVQQRYGRTKEAAQTEVDKFYEKY